ncbi:hypothetical protein A5686_24360 [Mycobacterium sp. E2479]|nr:hypothetical protein A5686_24360 [Mycobacterium sp. E2479]
MAASVTAYDPELVLRALTNISWIAAVEALTAWYIGACAANCVAVSADTSSVAAGTAPVGANAAPAEAAGCVVTKDI